MTEPKARLLVIGAGVNGSVCAAGLHREVDVSVLAALAPGRPPVLSRIARNCRAWCVLNEQGIRGCPSRSVARHWHRWDGPRGLDLARVGREWAALCAVRCEVGRLSSAFVMLRVSRLAFAGATVGPAEQIADHKAESEKP